MTIARDNIDALTGLRFIAAFSIVLGHAYMGIASVTAIGMPLFFTLSGFIIHYVYADAFAVSPRRAVGEFAVARFSRIYPLYVVLLLYFLFKSPMGDALRHIHELPILLAYLTATWTWWPYQIDGSVLFDWHYAISWSIPTEAFFYVCYALVLHRFERLRSIRVCLVLLIGLCFVAYLYFYSLFLTRDLWESAFLARFPQFAARNTDFNQSFYRWFLYISPYSRIFEFVAGVLSCQLFRLVRHQAIVMQRRHVSVIALAGLALLMGPFAAFCYFGANNPWLAVGNFSLGAFLVTLHMNFLLAPACCVLIFSLALGGSVLARILSSRPCRYLGDISYSTYLSHPMAPRVLAHLGIDAPSNTAYGILILPVIYAMSAVLYRLVEVPSKRWLRRTLDARLQVWAYSR
jgi:peptidoglycan/LPS O-acetylase OafA/YrhL